MKVIFLDFDGVLISGMYRSYNMGFLSPDRNAVDNLNKITEATGAKIVVSSTYRLGESVPDLRKRLNHFWKVLGVVMDKTPTHWNRSRGYEIQRWLDKWHESGGEDVQSFAIIDDVNDMEHLSAHLIHTNWEVGLTEADAERCIKLLNEGVYTHVPFPPDSEAERVLKSNGEFIETFEAKYKQHYQHEEDSGWENLPECEICQEQKAVLLHPHRTAKFNNTDVNLLVCKRCYAL